MGEVEQVSTLKETLMNICRSNGWSYGVLWSFDQRNSMLLTMEDAYYEDRVGFLVDDMLLGVHILGKGVVGQVAFTGKHQWIFSDVHAAKSSFSASHGSQDIFQDECRFYEEFSHGIKTISVIPVEAIGVLQFGSTQKISESLGFLDETKRLLRMVKNIEGRVPEKNTSTSSNGENFDLDGLFSSLISSVNSYDQSIVTKHGASSNELVGRFSSSKTHNVIQTSTSTTESLSQTSTTESLSTCEMRDQSIRNISPLTSNILDMFKDTAENGPDRSEITDSRTHLHNFPDVYLLDDFTTDLSNFFLGDELLQWVASSPDNAYNINPSQSISSSSSSGLIKSDVDFLSKSQILSVSNSDGQEISCMTHGSVHNVFGDLVFGRCLGDKPLEGGTSTNSNMGSTVLHQGLFSESGIEKLLEGLENTSTVTKTSLEDQPPASKRRTMESLFGDSNQAHLARFSDSCLTMNQKQPSYFLDRENSLLCKKEVFSEHQLGGWIGDHYSINTGNDVLGEPQNPQEPIKAPRKRARPGESNKPRPKDRQQIQDRIKELREIIPDCGKCSIDLLLDRTAKYMTFLQSVTKYADKIKQADKPKENGQLLKNKSTMVSGSSGIGTTWAFEVGEETMVCPVMVEDLGLPGHMLIEMHCEESAYFLEIADVIRGFGLTILKGVMEIRDCKIWARFIVEADRHITRIDVFWSLIQLLQQMSSRIDSADQPGILIENRVTVKDGFQKPSLPLPISLAETLW